MSHGAHPELTAALAALDAAALVKDVCASVRIPSVTGDERAVLDHLAVRAEALGLRATGVDHDLADLQARPGWPGQEVARDALRHVRVELPAPVAAPRLALCGHLDVVAPGEVPWGDGSAWSGALRDGAVWGRGASDMKGGTFAVLHALAAIARAGVTPAWAPTLLAVGSEEDGGQGAWAALEHDDAWDACVIPEPTCFDVVCSQAGALTFTGTVNGVAAHAGNRLLGISAIDRYLPVHEAFARLEAKLNADVADPLMRQLDLPYPLVIGRLDAGHWPSTVPDRLTFEGRVGVPVGVSPEAVRRRMEAMLVETGEGEVAVSWTGGQFAPGATDPEGPLASAALAATRAERGTAEVTGVPWGADMRLFTARGIPTVMLGTRGIDVAHTAVEHVLVEDLLACARIYVRLLLSAPT